MLTPLIFERIYSSEKTISLWRRNDRRVCIIPTEPSLLRQNMNILKQLFRHIIGTMIVLTFNHGRLII